MKDTSHPAAHMHVSIVSFAAEALGRSRAENIAAFLAWFRDIAEASPAILRYEILLGDVNAECPNNVCFTVWYADAGGLAAVRRLPEHQAMLAWFGRVSDGRMSVDTSLVDDAPDSNQKACKKLPQQP